MGGEAAAYSFLFLREREMVAVKDPLGIRPLCIGKLGDAAPAITKVKDVPNDQGKALQVEFTRSPDDGAGANDVRRYRISRKPPGGTARRRAMSVGELQLVQAAVRAARPQQLLVRADPGQLHQVIINLVINARDAVAGKKEGEIAIAKRIEAGRELMIGALCESPLTFEAITRHRVITSQWEPGINADMAMFPSGWTVIVLSPWALDDSR